MAFGAAPTSTVEKKEAERARGEMIAEAVEAVDLEPDDRHRQPYGLVHGGVYCSIVESLGSVGSATYAVDRGMVGAVGLSNSTDFLRSHREGRLNARATPIHGRCETWQK